MSSSFPPSLPVSRSLDIVGFGLNAVDYLITVPHYPPFNSKVRFLDCQTLPGGQVATAIAGLARLGLSTRYIGQVGDDEAGMLQIASLTNERVDTRIRVVAGVRTQTAFILVDRSTGERTIIWDRDDRLNFDPDALSPEIIQCGRVLHLDGHDVPASIRAARFAREAGMPVVIDVDNIYPGIEELLPLVTCLIGSAECPGRMTGEPDLRKALGIIQARFGNRLVVATLGREGALALEEQRWVTSPGFLIEARDTTGAGDAFRAGFIYGLIKGCTLEDALRSANAVAALNCLGTGARGGLPNRQELETFIAGPCRFWPPEAGS
ncbi:MAG: ribokinase [Acidobacteria bacterium]|nr:ribokinase [Acidobacteriota bacterium]